MTAHHHIRCIVRRLTSARGIAFVALAVALGTPAYAAMKIGSRDIINGSIKSVDIGNGQVKAVDLGASAVTGTKLAAGSVTESKLGAGSVTGAKLAAGSVAGTSVATGAIEPGNLSSGVAASVGAAWWNSSTFPADPVLTGTPVEKVGAMITIPRTGSYLLLGAISAGGGAGRGDCDFYVDESSASTALPAQINIGAAETTLQYPHAVSVITAGPHAIGIRCRVLSGTLSTPDAQLSVLELRGMQMASS